MLETNKVKRQMWKGLKTLLNFGQILEGGKESDMLLKIKVDKVRRMVAMINSIKV